MKMLLSPPHLSVILLRAGEVLFAQGDAGDALYLLEDGVLGIYATHGDTRRRINRLESGAILGETSVLDQAARSATAIAETDVRLIEVSGAYVRGLVRHADPILGALLGSLTAHLRSEVAQRLAEASACADDVQREASRQFTHLMHEPARQTLRLQADLLRALTEEELFVAYQPIRDLTQADYPIAGFEALLRWTRDGVPVRPDIMIAAAETCPLILPIGEFVLETALADQVTLSAALGRAVFVSVNVAPQQITAYDFLAVLEGMFADKPEAAAMIKLEITERAMLDSARAGAWIDAAHALGLTLALDDFGTGFSNLESLQRYRVDVIKIDGSFVRNLLTQQSALSICRGIIQLGQAFGIPVVAEHVEHEAQAAYLSELGCAFAQGYFRDGAPRPLPEMLAMLTR